MFKNKFPKKWRIRFLCIFIAVAAIAGAVAQEKRTPGQILPHQHAGILLNESRVNLEQPDKILQFMGLKDGDIVADIGCGNGFFALRLAKQIGPRGIVFAVDVQQGMLDQLIERQKEADITNIYPILGLYEDPLLPAGKVDWILLVDAYHEFSNPEPMLARMKECLAPGGRVALLEYRAEESSRGSFPIPRDHSMTVEEIMNEWPPSGFELVTKVDFQPVQHFFVFKNAEDQSRPAIRKLTIGNTPNAATFDHRYYFSGQPDENALMQFADFGVKTVINLRTEQEMTELDFDEKAIVEEAGMRYVHAPMEFEIPGPSTLSNIMNILDTAEEAPLLIHCGSSVRVGAIWAIYAGQRGNLEADDAIAEGKDAGMSASFFEAAVREVLSDNLSYK